MQYNKIKLIVGVFVIITTLSILSFSYYILKEKGVFDKKNHYTFITQSAKFLSVGMPLELSGFEIGTIDSISLRDDGVVSVRFSVSEKNTKWINKDTFLMMKKPLIGSPNIEVHSKIGAKELKQNAILPMMMSNDINDMIDKLEPVIERMTHIIESVETITSYLASNDSELLHILKNLDKFSDKLVNDRSLLTTITGDANSTKNVIASMNASLYLMQKLEKIVDDITLISANLDQDIVQPSALSIEELNAILQDVKDKLKRVDATVTSIGSYDKELLEMKENLSVAIEKSNRIMDRVDAVMQDENNAEVPLP